jgi:SAM-dependent methyltransferase
MKNNQYLKIIKHYENCFKKFGDNNLGVDWPKQEDALLRYKIMLEIIPKQENCTLLDFGCGLAHLYDFILKNSYQNIRYSGLDISNEFIKVCRQKYPDLNFICRDILESSEQIEMFDYIILNGVFTEKRELSFDEMYEYFKKMIKLLYLKSNKGIAFNVMTKHVDWEREDLFHLPFDLLASFLKSDISPNYIIRNDYGLFEYTVYLFKDPNIWHR